MKKRKPLFGLLCSTLCCFSAFVNTDAQNKEQFSFNSTLIPSVESYSISQYGKLAPSQYTGAMALNLDLYTYEDEDFTVPVSLGYSFSGYRPNVHSGTIGYGWSLNCGGLITREVLGSPDDSRNADNGVYGYARAVEHRIFDSQVEIYNGKQVYLEPYVASDSELSNVNLFSDIPLYQNGYDTCPDIFSFNFLGYTGDFMITQDGTVKVFNTNAPSGLISVECEFNDPIPSESSFSEIRIRTGDGFCYYFGGEHKNLEFSQSSDSRYGDYVITAWKLRKATAPNGNEVDFIYDEFQKDYSNFETYTPEIDADIVGGSLVMGDYESSKTLNYTNITYYHMLTEVKVNNKSLVKLSYSQKDYLENEGNCFKGDLYTSTYGIYAHIAYENCLESIQIFNCDSTLVDEISFEHMYTSRGSGSPRMFLSSVTSMQNGTHAFEYDFNQFNSFPFNDTYGTDYWGFWNGKDSLTSFKRYIKNPTHNYLYGLYDQLTDPSVKQSMFSYSCKGALTKVIYPTDGKTEIHYEPHQVEQVISAPTHFSANTNSIVPGGVRVAKIVNLSEEIKDSTVYSYDAGRLMQMPRYAVHLHYKYSGTFRDELSPGYTIHAIADMASIGYSDCSAVTMRGPHVVYPKVTAKYADGSTVVSEYLDILDMKDPQADIESIAKTHYMSSTDELIVDDEPEYIGRIKDEFTPATEDYSRLRGLVKSVVEHDSQGSLIRSEYRDYQSGMLLVHTQDMVYNTLLDFTKVPLNIYAPRLQNETRYVAYENGNAGERMGYSYNAFGQITESVRTCGDKKSYHLYKYYPEQYPSYGGDILKSALYAEAEIFENKEGDRYLLSVRQYHYDDISNPRPTRIDIYTAADPVTPGVDIFSVPETYSVYSVNFTYDNPTQRIAREDFPGGQYYTYEWDTSGRNIVSTEQNAPENLTEFVWKDMVGLTKIVTPTGQTRSYDYNSDNRLQCIKDEDGHLEKEYRYHLINDRQ